MGSDSSSKKKKRSRSREKHHKKHKKEKSKKKSRSKSPKRAQEQKQIEESAPSPQPRSFGPSLPSHLIKKPSEEPPSPPPASVPPAETSAPVSYGPALPPHLVARQNRSPSPQQPSIIGPVLPSHLRKPDPEPQPSSSSSEDEQKIVGPLPDTVNLELEQRALEIKLGRLQGAGGESSSGNVKHREEWMLELPDVKTVADLGLGARQFRTRDRPDLSAAARSGWTETPKEGEKKEAAGPKAPAEKVVTAEDELVKRRDAEQEAIVKKLKAKRKESLYEMHQKKLKKEKKDEEKVERRPFDRDVDLQVNRFDEAQKKAVLKKAQLLDTRFASGNSKYL